MNKYTLSLIAFVLAIIGLSQNVQVVFANEAEATIPTAVGFIADEMMVVSVGANDPETGAIVPNQTGASANETGAIIPNTGNTNANETDAIIANGVGSNADESGTPAIITPVTPVTPVTPSGSSGGSSYSSGGSVQLFGTTNSTSAFIPGTCPLITDYLKAGSINDIAQVTRLQSFLKNVEKLNVDVNGVFDQKTEDAVKAFQIKYLDSVMGPWNATRATGFVYITTLKKINELACALPFTLNADEQAIIKAYKDRISEAEQTTEIDQQVTPVASSTLEVGTDDDSNVAAVGRASILSRFWNFIKNLFR